MGFDVVVAVGLAGYEGEGFGVGWRRVGAIIGIHDGDGRSLWKYNADGRCVKLWSSAILTPLTGTLPIVLP